MIIRRLYQLQLTIKFSDKIKYRGLLNKRGNKTPPSECLSFAVDRPVIASNAESPRSPRERTRARYMYAHAILTQRAGGRRDRPEINRNCNNPITRYHLFRAIQWIGLTRSGSATNGGGYRNSRAVLTHIYTHTQSFPYSSSNKRIMLDYRAITTRS